jgi:glycerophosphoryl diester phosphodiesterase
MARRYLTPATLAALLALAPATAQAAQPTLTGRAILPADAAWPAPFAAAPGAQPVPAAGATQPVGGFSALIRDHGGSDWALPDNGFGTKANSRSFLLRIYAVTPHYRTASGGAGTVAVRRAITLRDPGLKVPWRIVEQGTRARLLTGADFDPESLRRVPDGTFWVGDEFGPYLLHFSRSGKLLERPIGIRGVKAPENPTRSGAATLDSSGGLESLAMSPDGRTLYPILEKAVYGDGPRTRRVYAFDRRTHRLRLLARYPIADAEMSVSDASALDAHRLVLIEHENFATATVRRTLTVVDLRHIRHGMLRKRSVLDLRRIADPAGISLAHQRPGDIGLGNPFSYPYQTTESVLALGGTRVALVNDTNFGSHNRNPALPDESDFITVKVPGL